MNNEDIVVVTGGFDPIHSGHVEYIKDARKHGRVIIGLNSDEWLKRKKGRPFMSFEDRKAILEQFKDVLCVIEFDDSDESASDAIAKAKEMFPLSKIKFANGGDRTKTNIPEMEAFGGDESVEFIFSVGGDNKKNSSSWILEEWTNPSEERIWGKFITYYDSKKAKVKRLVLSPGKSISMQYHNERAEYWFVESGEGAAFTLDNDGEEILVKHMQKHDSYEVPVGNWHRLENAGEDNLCIIEIQYGYDCKEEDIVRK